MTFVIATHNAHKLIELERILRPLGITAVTDRDLGKELPEVEETGTTFAENAYLKAAAACAFTGLPAIADDSGLCVDALHGEPGVYSARYTGRHEDSDEDRRELVLRKMEGCTERSARFVCALCCLFPNGDEIVSEQTMEGSILYEARGQGGFGYDPIFLPEGCDRSNAELSPEEKNAISHRGKALRDFVMKWEKYYVNQ